MSKLLFDVQSSSGVLKSVELPVEVRKPSLALAARSVTSEQLEGLDPGEYYVTAELPGGQQLVGHVLLGENETRTVTLALRPEDASPHEYLEKQHYLWGVTGYESHVEALGVGDVPKLRLFVGNAARNESVPPPIPDQIWLRKLDQVQPPGVCVYNCRVPSATLVQMLYPGRTPINVAMPPAHADEFELLVALQPGDDYKIEAHLQPEADTLLRYMEQGLLTSAAKVASSSAGDGERLLSGKVADPISAAVGAYAILRVGELERLHEWTLNLANWFPDLPDGLAIRGEHLARVGKHREAFRFFVQLTSRGLPFITDGLTYTVDRLRLYASGENYDFTDEDISQAREQLAYLTKFTPYVDFSKAILTFTGTDPNKPSADPVSRPAFIATPGVAVEI